MFGHGFPVGVAPYGVDSVDPRMTGSKEVMVHPADVPTQGERDVLLGSTFQRGDPDEDPLLGVGVVQVLLLFYHISSVQAPLVIFCAESMRASMPGCSLSGSSR